MNYLLKLISLSGRVADSIRRISYQKKFWKQTFEPILAESRKTNDGSLDADDLRKISLYGITIPALMGDAFCLLRNRPMTRQERLTMTALGAITGLFDDFFDKRNLSLSEIKSLLENPDQPVLNDSYEKLIVRLYHLAYENCSVKGELKSACAAVFDAEVWSKKQLLPDTDRNEIREIILRKGGVSMLLYSCALGDSLSSTDREIIYKLGGIGQLENDIFDVYADYQDGIRTLATTENSIQRLRNTYHESAAEIFALVRKTSYPAKNKTHFLQLLSLVLARGLVCLDHLQKSEKKTGNIFSVSVCSKADLNCDMEKPLNFFRMIHYAATTIYSQFHFPFLSLSFFKLSITSS